MLTLWGGGTTRTLRAHWALHELGLEYEQRLIGSRTGETQTDAFRALNAKEKIPVLVDGDFVLTESAAIVTWLGDTYGEQQGVALTPPFGTRERARYNEWVSFTQMELDAHTLYVMRKHRDLAHLYGEAPAAVDTAIEGFNKQVQVAERHLAGHDYLVGGAFTGADILLGVCLFWAKAYGIGIAPTLEDYLARLQARPAYQSAAALNFSVSAGG